MMLTSLGGLALAGIGTPLFIVICALAVAAFAADDVDLTIIFIEMYRLADTPALTAIPLFAFCGFVLAESDAAGRLVRISEAVLGWLPGGMAIMALISCALLTAFTGASGMTIVAVGGLLFPALLQSRYPESFSLGLITTSGSLGLLFPPSIPLIIYGIVSETPVDSLFVAGIVPGFMLVVALSLYAYFVGLTRTRADRPPLAKGAALRSMRDGVWELLLPTVVIGGIYSGIIAVSEAAAMSVLYVLIVEMIIHREV
ncbi:MAG: TRAP transporter large permease subunit, partial [Candidatus Latescibacterota bacterium]|nr:TRAP transporter large permease subunit [Candidatus Latescibacterota bacterium]